MDNRLDATLVGATCGACKTRSGHASAERGACHARGCWRLMGEDSESCYLNMRCHVMKQLHECATRLCIEHTVRHSSDLILYGKQ